MTAPTPSPTISAAPPAWAAADWNALRTAGLAYVERYAHDLWTDYNRHDPGITILELLCYAITDLSQRTSLDTKDILRSAYASDADMAASFLRPELVLPSSPVTLLDYRKLLLDVPGVRNAWLRPHAQRVHVALPDARKYLDAQAQLDHDPAARARLSYPATPVPATSEVASRAAAAGLDFDLQGLYDITVDLDVTDLLAAEPADGSGRSEAELQAQVLADVRAAYLSHRNLGEDCVRVRPLPVQWVVLCADIDLAPGASAGAVQAQLLLAVDQYLAPPVPRYSLAEMLAQTDAAGRPLTADQIFEGPLLNNGFIRDADLRASTLRNTVFASDIVALAMAIPGIAAIRNLRLSALKYNAPTPTGFAAEDFVEDDFQLFGTAPAETTPDADTANWVIDKQAAGQAWQLTVAPGAQPQLAPAHTALNFFQGLLPVGKPDEQRDAIDKFKDLKASAATARIRRREELPFPTGTPYDLAAYRPLALDFPANYGIGPAGLPADAPAARRNQARQLKAYLLFFDQLLANYLTQLANVNKLFGADQTELRTYFGQLLHSTDLPGVAELYALPPADPNQPALTPVLTPDLVATPADDTAGAGRKSRFLDHLLARFAENFSEYGLLMYSLDGQRADPEVLQDKAALAGDLGRFEPARGYDYRLPSWAGDPLPGPLPRKGQPVEPAPLNVAGIARRFGRLAGMSNFQPRSSASLPPSEARTVSAADEETIFVVEHLLLRPEVGPTEAADWLPACTDPSGAYCAPLDPYSFRVSIVLPGYTARFQDVDYRRYAERMLRLELPAHVLARICWVGHDDLRDFELAYHAWLREQERWARGLSAPALPAARRALLTALNELNTVYQPGTLYSCATSADADNPLVLGRTTLGSVAPPPVVSHLDKPVENTPLAAGPEALPLAEPAPDPTAPPDSSLAN